MPIACASRGKGTDERLLVAAGSAIIAPIAATRLVQRAFNLQLIGG